MRYDRNFHPEWGYVAAAPSVMRTARLIAVAAIIGATASAATVFSLLDRPAAEESVAARTLVTPDPGRPLTASTSSVAAQQPTEPQQVKSPAEAENSAEQKAPPASAAGAAASPLPSELATTSTPQPPTGAAPLAKVPAVKETLSAQTFNDTVAVAPDPTPKPQSKKPRMTSQLPRVPMVRTMMPGVTADTLTGLATDMSHVTGTSRATARGGRSPGTHTTDLGAVTAPGNRSVCPISARAHRDRRPWRDISDIVDLPSA